MTMSIALALGIGTLCLYMVYKWSLPHPIPGIPYNQTATRSILGDVPNLFKYVKETGESIGWFPKQVEKLQSPIIQVFVRPFAKPWVVIADFRESQDILMRRTKEFDRGSNFRQILSGITLDHHIIMPSSAPEFKAHRRLIQDLMTPAFLHNVSAPRIYASISTLVGLWSENARLAGAHPFSASEDFYSAALDAIWMGTFPFQVEDGVVNARRELLIHIESIESQLPVSINEPAVFPDAMTPPAQASILTLTESLEVAMKSLFPRLAHWFLRWRPYMRKARVDKEAMISDALEKGKTSFSRDKKNGNQARCALDYILYRKLAAAKKENRTPEYKTRVIYDEITGHDTTSITVAWGLKLLSDHPEVQERLLEAIQKVFPTAIAENLWPTVQEITNSHISYLDATQEEIIRKSLTAGGVSRITTVDTVLLGHSIKKGTNILMLGNGPGYVAPSIGMISEETRSESCRSTKSRIVSWNPDDSHLFKPDRWLATKDEAITFDSTAGPLLTFGLGPRG